MMLDRISDLRGELLGSNGRPLPFVISTTSKGNGTLEVANLTVRIIDRHDDGILFDPPLLDITVIEDDNKICLGFTISGWMITTGEKGGEETSREFISIHFVYEEKTQRFVSTPSIASSGIVLEQDRK